MIEIVTSFLHTSILPMVQEIGLWFYIIVICIAILESTIVIGTFVPGTVMLLFFGFTASQGDVGLFAIIIATSIGAIIGDLIGYSIGRYGIRFVNDTSRLLRISHVEIGRAFFTKHGGKSILLGRFIGPIRQIIPFVAGAVRMKYRSFMVLNISGAFLWAASYILLGFYFGENSELIDNIISRIGIVLTGLLVIVGAYVFHIHRTKKLEELKNLNSL